MIELIGFIPQSSQGIFREENFLYSIDFPYQNFSISRIFEEVELTDLPLVKSNALFKSQEHLRKHLEQLHLFELIANDKIIEKYHAKLERITNIVEDEKQKKNIAKETARLELIEEELEKTIWVDNELKQEVEEKNEVEETELKEESYVDYTYKSTLKKKWNIVIKDISSITNESLEQKIVIYTTQINNQWLKKNWKLHSSKHLNMFVNRRYRLLIILAIRDPIKFNSIIEKLKIKEVTKININNP